MLDGVEIRWSANLTFSSYEVRAGPGALFLLTPQFGFSGSGSNPDTFVCRFKAFSYKPATIDEKRLANIDSPRS
jgi:hypothetical protein